MGDYVRSHDLSDREEEWDDSVKCLVTRHCAPSYWGVSDARQVTIPVPSLCATCSKEQRATSGKISFTFTLRHFTRSQVLHVPVDFQTPTWSSPNGTVALEWHGPVPAFCLSAWPPQAAKVLGAPAFPLKHAETTVPFSCLRGTWIIIGGSSPPSYWHIRNIRMFVGLTHF